MNIELKRYIEKCKKRNIDPTLVGYLKSSNSILKNLVDLGVNIQLLIENFYNAIEEEKNFKKNEKNT